MTVLSLSNPMVAVLQFQQWSLNECERDLMPFPEQTDSSSTCVWVGLVAIILVAVDTA